MLNKRRRNISNKFFVVGFVNMCVEHIKSPLENAKTKIDHIYTGPNTSKVYDDMVNCDQEGLLMVSKKIVLVAAKAFKPLVLGS